MAEIDSTFQDEDQLAIPDVLPLLPVRDIVVFPYLINMSASAVIAIAIALEKSILISEKISFPFENKNRVFQLNKESLKKTIEKELKGPFSLDDIKKLKKERSIFNTAKKHLQIYKQLLV